MAVVNLYEGGTRPTGTTNSMLPSAGAASVVGYADHQRRRSYAVTRQMRFGPRFPYGGEGNASYNDQADWCWYSDLVAGGGNVAANDVWNLIIIPPNTRLEWIAVWVWTGVTGLQFDVEILDDAGAQSGIIEISNVGAAASGPTIVEITAAERFSTALRYVGVKFDTVPAAAGVAKLQGLDFAVQAEVVDWGSYDFNGNA